MTDKQQALFKARQERNRRFELNHLQRLLHNPTHWRHGYFRKWWERHRN